MTASALSDYLEDKLLDHVLGGGDYTPPANVFASLHTAALNDAGSGTEVSGNNYSRKSISNDATNFPAAVSGSKFLHVLQQFATPSASWGTAVSAGLWDASSAGNLLWRWDPASLAIGSGDIIQLAVDAIAFSLAGAASTYLQNKLLDLVLSGAAFTRPATVYLAAFVSGSEVTGNNYSRKSITNNSTNFPAASGGAKNLATDQTMASPSGSWGVVDSFRLYDASSGGNQLFTITPATPKAVGLNAPARFLANTMQFSIS